MSDLTRKVCMIGDFGVGKTSLVARFVRGIFSQRYLTTMGVKIDTKEVELTNGRFVKLVLWDVAGTNTLSSVERNYLRGASGYLLVADGTRSRTLESARELHAQTQGLLGDVPFLLLLNKNDLPDEWEVDDSSVPPNWQVMTSSAKTGEGVEAAFAALASRVIDR